jgi:hypothetical protein
VDTALQEVFPVLFGITCTNDASVAALVELFGGVTQWNVIFASAAHDWEVEAFALFFRVLNLARIRREGEDKLWWVPSKRGLFGIKSFYSVMGCHDNFRFP